MLLDNDVVTNRESKPGALADRFRVEEWKQERRIAAKMTLRTVQYNP
jgi:hypothetical protein